MTMAVAFRATRHDRSSHAARQVGKWVDKVLGASFKSYTPGEGWWPAVNICESEDHYCIVVDIAGMSSDKLDLKTEGRTVTLSGHRDPAGMPKECKKARMRHMEIDHGSFSRTFELPSDANLDEIEARYRSGFLWVMIPKRT
jgi:HSP20 family protein